MKSIRELQQEMDNIQVEISTNMKAYTEVQVNRMKKRFAFLGMCRAYLESLPTEDFLNKEKDRLNNKINLINAGYVPNQKLLDAGLNKQEQEEHKEYNKLMNMAKWKGQLKAIKFLI